MMSNQIAICRKDASSPENANVSNPATAALLVQNVPCHATITSPQVPTFENPLLQWSKLLGGNESDDGSKGSASRQRRQSSNNNNQDDSETSYDDEDEDEESLTESEEEEETRLARALVRATYNGLSTSALDNLLGRTDTLKRQQSAIQCTMSTSQPPQVGQIVEPLLKKQRVIVYQSRDHLKNLSSDHSASGAIQPSTVIPIQPIAAIMEAKRPLNNSSSLPMLRIMKPPATAAAATFSSATLTSVSTLPPPLPRNDIKPDDMLRKILDDAKYPEPKMIPFTSLTDFFTELTLDAVAAYDLPVVQALRNENVAELRVMKENGKPMQCGNKFGETILHAAARRRSAKVVQFLLQECDVTPRVCCDSGRTPLHDACWTVETNFDVVDLLLDSCPDLLYITDKRGFTPMAYVRKELWVHWCTYLNQRGAEKLMARELF